MVHSSPKQDQMHPIISHNLVERQTCLVTSKKLFRIYRSTEFCPSRRSPAVDRLPVLVKSVLRAPVPEYALLTTFALSAQTTISWG